MLILKNNAVYINTFLSFSAISFQIGVLYPWHKHLEDKIDKINLK